MLLFAMMLLPALIRPVSGMCPCPYARRRVRTTLRSHAEKAGTMLSNGAETVVGLLLVGSAVLMLWRQILVILVAGVVAVFAVGVDGVLEMLAR